MYTGKCTQNLMVKVMKITEKIARKINYQKMPGKLNDGII